jgi:hypothetical protein
MPESDIQAFFLHFQFFSSSTLFSNFHFFFTAKTARSDEMYDNKTKEIIFRINKMTIYPGIRSYGFY